MESSSGLFSGSLLTQFTIWLLALLQFILALYVFVINAWQRPTLRRAANYLVISLFVLALNTFAEGWLVGTSSLAQATLPTILLAISAPAVPVALLLSSISLLRFNLLHPADKGTSASAVERRKWLVSVILRWGATILILLPLVFTLIDLVLSCLFVYIFSPVVFGLTYRGILFRWLYTQGCLYKRAVGAAGYRYKFYRGQFAHPGIYSAKQLNQPCHHR